ncbi:MAG: pantoate--beta-alanine ligase [Synergistota bacterium]|nr:pantoate--beta-alanine ligase [Synergistota bacterium]
MQIAATPEQIRAMGARARMQGKSIGLTPTMGFLHEGHLSLVRRARDENDVCAVSIFVNPIQFGPNEDLEGYPRDMERDMALLKQEGVDFLYTPTVEAMYGPGFSVTVSENRLSLGMCGASRPGHFDGVCTVVMKLFNAVRPDRAYFGQKDFQQLQVIRKMTQDMDMQVEVVGCPIVREPDGLAMSSRNTYLSQDERQRALALSRSLFEASDLFGRGERRARAILDGAFDFLNSAQGVEPEYVDLRDAETLETVAENIAKRSVLAVAARVGPARLIDNILLDPHNTEASGGAAR